MDTELIFQLAVLIMSVVIHEVSHGYAALALGDQTAKYEGRLTLNPLRHLDPMGSFFVPLVSYMLGGFIIGWAKPVPYNPHNLRPGRWSEAVVAGAGPASNLVVAVIFGLLLRAGMSGGLGVVNTGFISIVTIIVFINIVLALFNLMPVPPLDGSKLLFAIFSENFIEIRHFFERHSLVLLLYFIFFLWQFIFPVSTLIFSLITGISL